MRRGRRRREAARADLPTIDQWNEQWRSGAQGAYFDDPGELEMVDERVETMLPALAREINARYEKEASGTCTPQELHDNRLAATVALVQAREICLAGKVPFRAWCKDHLRRGVPRRKDIAPGVAPPLPRRLRALPRR